ncbi:MAG: diguanylate cyclase, partial [Pseudomonadota bacterium]
GGDEFVVAALNHDERPSSLPAINRHLAEQIARPVPLREGSASVTASIGLALFPEDGRTLNELLTRADEDMYRVKGSTALRPSPLGIVGTP